MGLNLNMEELAGGEIISSQNFFSRKNRVSLNKIMVKNQIREVVVKEHQEAEGARKEFLILKKLLDRGLQVPEAYGYCGRKLYLQYLDGVLLADLLDRTAYCPQWAEKLAEWLGRLHRVFDEGGTGFLKGDVNLRNFIYHKDTCYGIDFEKECLGPPERDVGETCAFILAQRPAFLAEKFSFAEIFLHHYLLFNSSVERKKIAVEIERSLEEMAVRRQAQREEIRLQLKKIKKTYNLY